METITKRKPFETIGEKSKREIFYDIIHGYDYGERFSYEQLKSMSGFDFRVNSGRQIVYGVNKLLLKRDFKYLINVRNYGYKIAMPSEQIAHASERKKSGIRDFVKGGRELEGLNKKKITPEEKIKAAHLLNSLNASLHIARKRNIEGIKKALKAIEVQKKAVEAQEETGIEIKKMAEDIRKMKKMMGLK